ncbi:MAG: hypothetical protein HBSIN02_25030 [Bacteroidia bacterium]|nr:MAG: hypothetical protein HBSIN02_25030 [Bacteroidia bacterium]
MNLALIISFGLSTISPAQGADSSVVRDLIRLEHWWNKAHVEGDTTTLKQIWADELLIVVPQMKPMTKDDGLSFWRSGAFKIEEYETDSVHVHVMDSSHAVVRGILHRVRNMRGKRIEESWRFEKSFILRDRRWQVTRWEAQSMSTK